ncbi:hypothetical protein VHUM_00546 [Vanrija humicola]|uniref:Amino acid permease/ SLC12A domain-containing protein n=1 Tax=Vanrija humicola TaxID=5417 RepID=A0A7D8Z8R2_VANHU|nr:hypothetical protein VHUM_00546 [Vanrija humicola]
MDLSRGLKSRHLTMISIGGVLGTGLFLYTGAALQEGGPLGILLAFSIMGSVTYAVMISLGEMVSASPLPGGAISLAARFVDESLSFTLGWFYWYTWTIFLPSELSAIAVLVNLWNTSVNNAVWISIFLVAAVGINMMGSAWYGETEFWLSYIKIFLIVGLIIVDIVISAGGVKGAPAIGFKYWRTPGPFVQAPGVGGALGRFLGFWSTLTRAAFSYIGSEIVAIAAGETQNPRKNVPRAIRNVYIRILLFYILGVFVIGITVPSDDPRLGLNSGTALASPFVIAIQTAGIKVLPTIVNAALLASGLSAANSELFTSSRALHGLAVNGHAPGVFGRTSARGVPYVAILSCAAFGALAYMSIKSSAGTAFGYLATLGSAGGLLMWWGVCVIHIRFEKGLRLQRVPRADLPYTNVLTRRGAAAKYAVVLITIILFFSGYGVFLKGAWDTPTFITTYLPIMLFPVVYGGHKLWTRCKVVPYEDMVFNVYADVQEEKEESKSRWRRLFDAVV